MANANQPDCHDELIIQMNIRIAAEESLELSRINLTEAQIRFNSAQAASKKALRDEEYAHKQLIKASKNSKHRCTIS
jgi:hypothetical protein